MVATLLKQEPSIELRKEKSEENMPPRYGTFSERVDAIKATENVSTLAAKRKARREFPESFEAFNKRLAQETGTIAKNHNIQFDKSATPTWDSIVDDIRKSENVTRCEAMRLARLRHSEVYKRYRG